MSLNTCLYLSVYPIKAADKQYGINRFLGILLPALTYLITALVIGHERIGNVPGMIGIKTLYMALIGLACGVLCPFLCAGIVTISDRIVKNNSEYKYIQVTGMISYAFMISFLVSVIGLTVHFLTGTNTGMLFCFTGILLSAVKMLRIIRKSVNNDLVLGAVLSLCLITEIICMLPFIYAFI